MFRRLLTEERGYSLTEVMASILILAIAILPMVGMFDMGLRTATTGSNYDKGRTLANLKLEEAKSLPFGVVRDRFPEPVGTTTTYDGSGSYQSPDWKPADGPASAEFANFEYMVTKQYMAQPPTDSDADLADPTETFTESNTATSLIRITVTVQFPDGDTYTTVGLVAG